MHGLHGLHFQHVHHINSPVSESVVARARKVNLLFYRLKITTTTTKVVSGKNTYFGPGSTRCTTRTGAGQSSNAVHIACPQKNGSSHTMKNNQNNMKYLAHAQINAKKKGALKK